MGQNIQMISDFYCTQCGSQGLPVVRTAKHAREPGHLKKLYCPNCRIQTNMVEIRDYGQYKKEDFLTEFKYGNFDEEGKRIDPSWRHFISEINRKIEKGELNER